MVRVGLTGGLACGKSTVAEMFRKRGAHVIHADRIAHELLCPGEEVYAAVVRAFGSEILNSDLTIERARLARLAFPDRVEELNRIVHPAVVRRQEAWMAEVAAREPQAVIMVEAALIFEAGVHRRFDKIVVVTCTPEQKMERFLARVAPSMDADQARAEAQRRIAAQIPDEQKVAAADYVIDNSGALELTEAQVEKVHRELAELAKREPST
jgi:dephospho-CoA kinase